MNLPIQFIVAIALIAIALLVANHTKRSRDICGTCLERFSTEAGLDAHIEAEHGRCGDHLDKHCCTQLADHHGAHVCGCRLDWYEPGQAQP